MDMPHDPAANLAAYHLERAMLDPQQQAELWQQIASATNNDQELLLARESLIYALPPRAIYALHPDQFANLAMIYGMKRNLFMQLLHNQVIERLCSEGALAQSEDT
jgi:hypothetical protein